jgi:S-adenosylmethionine:tRNA ribosyltransferase-isomerase
MNPDFLLASYQYDLPAELIAQSPAEARDASRLLVLDCRADTLVDRAFGDVVDCIEPGDLLVVNDTRVFPARLLGRKETGGQVELFLLEYPAGAPGGEVEGIGLVRSSKRVREGMRLFFGQEGGGQEGRGIEATVLELLSDGKVRVLLRVAGSLDAALEAYGQLPLPPYIDRSEGERPGDRERYQTVYAAKTGAVAAPTAGLHFTEALLARLRDRGVLFATVTLHVGYGTFAPVRVADIRDHQIHAEYLEVSAESAELVNRVRESGKRVWAVGTTSVRALEFAADETGRVRPMSGLCDLYLYPGYQFRVVQNLITNFHLPGSSLLFLVSALAGRERILRAYRHAVAERYRFFSYGDAMVILR